MEFCSILGTNVKETIAKPTNLYTEPINPEIEYGYAENPGVVDANFLVEGDIINYYYDKEKEPISCAVLYNDNTHGLQVVTLNSVREVTLGYDSTNKDPESNLAFESETPKGYDSADLIFEKNRWSYNHIFQTLKKYAMDYIGNMAVNARCVGAPDSVIEDEGETNNMYKDEEYRYIEHYNNKFKNSDNWHLDEVLSKMDSLNILKTQNPSDYWIASRVVILSDLEASGHVTRFTLKYADLNGPISNHQVSALGSFDGETIAARTMLAKTNGFRPLFILRDDIKIEKTGHLD